jgi:signal transduction histidine kinase
LSLGAEDYITKSVDLLELVARIHAILRRKEKVDLLARQEVRQLLENLSTSLPIHTSHHFRTNLGILLLSLEMLAKNQAPNDQYLEYARNSAYRIKTWMETLIWLNEFDLGCEAIMDEELDLESAFRLPIQEVVDIWHEKNLQIDLQVDYGIVVFAPARAFTQAVCHLVDNACKFSPEGGQVKIHLQANGLIGSQLTVQDQGPGIPKEMRKIVFERFFQIHDDRGLPENHGMGLGLYMAQAFARTQGGDVHILESDSGCWVQMKLRNKPYCP